MNGTSNPTCEALDEKVVCSIIEAAITGVVRLRKGPIWNLEKERLEGKN